MSDKPLDEKAGRDKWTRIDCWIGPHAPVPGWSDGAGDDPTSLASLTDAVTRVVMTWPMPEGADPSVSGCLNGDGPPFEDVDEIAGLELENASQRLEIAQLGERVEALTRALADVWEAHVECVLGEWSHFVTPDEFPDHAELIAEVLAAAEGLGEPK